MRRGWLDRSSFLFPLFFSFFWCMRLCFDDWFVICVCARACAFVLFFSVFSPLHVLLSLFNIIIISFQYMSERAYGHSERYGAWILCDDCLQLWNTSSSSSSSDICLCIFWVGCMWRIFSPNEWNDHYRNFPILDVDGSFLGRVDSWIVLTTRSSNGRNRNSLSFGFENTHKPCEFDAISWSSRNAINWFSYQYALGRLCIGTAHDARTQTSPQQSHTHTHRGVIRPDWQWTTIAINTHTDTFIVTLKTVGQLSSRIEYEIVPFLWNQILLLSIFDVCCCCCHSILLCVCVHFHLRIHLVELSEIRSSLLPYIIVQNYMIWRTGNSSTNSTQNY